MSEWDLKSQTNLKKKKHSISYECTWCMEYVITKKFKKTNIIMYDYL